jgi:hypothetical protein
MNEDRLVLRRERHLAEIVGDGLQVYGTPPLLALLFVLAIPGAVLGLTLLAISLNTAGFLEFALTFPVGFIGNAVLGSGAVYALNQRESGTPVAPGTALLAALGRASDLIVAAIKITVIVILFCVTIVGIPWGIHRVFRWLYTTHVIMIDGVSGDDSLEASAYLVAGRGWATAGRIIVIQMIFGVPILIIGGIVAFTSTEATAGLINVLLTAVAFPFTVSATLMVFYHLKLTRREVPRFPGESTPPVDPV